MKELRKIKCAFVGIGNFGSKLARIAQQTNKFEIIMAYHPSKPKREWLFSPITNKEADIYERDGIELVFITSPNTSHYDHIRASLAADKHIFVEKPITSNRMELDELLKYIQEKPSVKIMVVHNYRRHRPFRLLKQIVESETFGKPTFVIANIGHNGGLRFRRNNWRAFISECREGPLIMLGIHYIDVIRYLFGEFEHCKGIGINQFGVLETIETFCGTFKLRSGLVGNLTCSYVAGEQEMFLTFFENGRVEILNNNTINSYYGDSTPCHRHCASFLDLGDEYTYREELEELHSAILFPEKNIETDAMEGILSLDAVFRLFESAIMLPLC